MKSFKQLMDEAKKRPNWYKNLYKLSQETIKERDREIKLLKKQINRIIELQNGVPMFLVNECVKTLNKTKSSYEKFLDQNNQSPLTKKIDKNQK